MIKRHNHRMLLSKKENLKGNLTSVSLRVILRYFAEPKRDLGGIKYWRFARNTLSETKIQNLHP